MIKTLILALALLAGTTKPLDVKDETDQELNGALDQFHNWGTQHKGLGLIEICWRKDGNSPWTARLYEVNGEAKPLEWEEVGYPRLMLAVVQVEKDFDQYPKGHAGLYH